MTFAECVNEANHCLRAGRDEDARGWLLRACESPGAPEPFAECGLCLDRCPARMLSEARPPEGGMPRYVCPVCAAVIDRAFYGAVQKLFRAKGEPPEPPWAEAAEQCQRCVFIDEDCTDDSIEAAGEGRCIAFKESAGQCASCCFSSNGCSDAQRQGALLGVCLAYHQMGHCRRASR